MSLYDLASLFAGKLHALLCRGWKNRVKGRDYYDFVWHVGRKISPNLAHPDARMRQSGHWAGEPITAKTLRNLLGERFAKVDFKKAADGILLAWEPAVCFPPGNEDAAKKVSSGINDMKPTTCLLVALITPLAAETVEWTVSGAVTAADGGFAGAGITQDTKVEVRFTYNSLGEYVGINVIPSLGYFEWDYRSGINLDVAVSIGDMTWHGTVASGNAGAPYTLIVRDMISDVARELVKPMLDELDGAVFQSFPLSLGGGRDAVRLTFNGAPDSTTMVNNGIAAAQIQPDQIADASGTISTADAGGASQSIGFSLDPATLVVTALAQPPAPPVSIEVAGGWVTLRWPTEAGISYVVESSTDLKEGLWFRAFNLIGDGNQAEQSFPQLGASEFYRVLRMP